MFLLILKADFFNNLVLSCLFSLVLGLEVFIGRENFVIFLSFCYF